jgi:hypothetical protein
MKNIIAPLLLLALIVGGLFCFAVWAMTAQKDQPALINSIDNVAPVSESQTLDGEVEINTLDSNQTQVVNSGFKYKLTFPESTYNIQTYGPDEVLVMDPGNRGEFIQIRAAEKNAPFSTRSFESPAGYPQDQSCETSVATVAAVSAKKYDCVSSVYYIVERGDYHYSIRVSDNDAYQAATDKLLSGLSFTD